MKFLNKVHYQSQMNPLELELYTNIKNIIGIHPFYYEYVFMVDADTEVFGDSLKRLVSSMVHDTRVILYNYNAPVGKFIKGTFRLWVFVVKPRCQMRSLLG